MSLPLPCRLRPCSWAAAVAGHDVAVVAVLDAVANDAVAARRVVAAVAARVGVDHVAVVALLVAGLDEAVAARRGALRRGTRRCCSTLPSSQSSTPACGRSRRRTSRACSRSRQASVFDDVAVVALLDAGVRRRRRRRSRRCTSLRQSSVVDRVAVVAGSTPALDEAVAAARGHAGVEAGVGVDRRCRRRTARRRRWTKPSPHVAVDAGREAGVGVDCVAVVALPRCRRCDEAVAAGRRCLQVLVQASVLIVVAVVALLDAGAHEAVAARRGLARVEAGVGVRRVAVVALLGAVHRCRRRSAGRVRCSSALQ